MKVDRLGQVTHEFYVLVTYRENNSVEQNPPKSPWPTKHLLLMIQGDHLGNFVDLNELIYIYGG